MNANTIHRLDGLLESSNQDKVMLKKKDGLFERVKSQRVILTEDNRQLLND